MESSPSGAPVQVVSITPDHKFVLNEEKLKEILFHKRAVGKKVEKRERIFYEDKWRNF